MELARGRKGEGLAAYAERIGRDKGDLSHLRDAAEVAQRVGSSQHVGHGDLLDKARHLYEVSRTDPALWPVLVDRLLAEGWSAADTRGRVAATQDAYEAVPAGERDTLDPQELVVGAAPRALPDTLLLHVSECQSEGGCLDR